MTLSEARELAVLSVLRTHPMHGYGIAQVLGSGPLSLLGLSRHAVYAILDRFRKRGWLIGQTQQDGAHPEKEVLSLTPEAEAAFLSYLNLKSGALSAPVTPTLAIAMCVDAGAPVPAAILQNLLEEREARLANWQDDPHRGTISEMLSSGIIAAEISALRAALARVSG